MTHAPNHIAIVLFVMRPAEGPGKRDEYRNITLESGRLVARTQEREIEETLEYASGQMDRMIDEMKAARNQADASEFCRTVSYRHADYNAYLAEIKEQARAERDAKKAAGEAVRVGSWAQNKGLEAMGLGGVK